MLGGGGEEGPCGAAGLAFHADGLERERETAIEARLPTRPSGPPPSPPADPFPW